MMTSPMSPCLLHRIDTDLMSGNLARGQSLTIFRYAETPMSQGNPVAARPWVFQGIKERGAATSDPIVLIALTSSRAGPPWAFYVTSTEIGPEGTMIFVGWEDYLGRLQRQRYSLWYLRVMEGIEGAIQLDHTFVPCHLSQITAK